MIYTMLKVNYIVICPVVDYQRIRFRFIRSLTFQVHALTFFVKSLLFVLYRTSDLLNYTARRHKILDDSFCLFEK